MNVTRKLLLVNLLGLLCTTVVVGMVVVSERVVDQRLRHSNRVTAVKRQALEELLGAAGYGGAIHHMKNYVLRGDAGYVVAFDQSLLRARRAITRYRQVPMVSDLEFGALDDIGDMLDAYAQAMAVAEALAHDPRAIDDAVRIDDSGFIAAIDTLRDAVDQEHATTQTEVLSAVRSAEITAIAAGVASLLVMGLVGSTLVVRLGRSITRSERELQQKVVERDAACDARDAFLANMSHEIRTPMTAILGFADLIDVEDQSDEARVRVRESVQVIQRNASHLLAIVNDVLDMAKLQAGRISVEREPMSLHVLIADVVSLMRPLADNKSIVLAVDCPPDAPDWIHCDPVRLRQIVLNLLSNAIKFTEDGGVEITVRAAGRERIEVSVSDTGIGLAPEDIQRIFVAFEQADASSTRRAGGAGLGLRISRHLAHLLDGEITVKSAIGEGSCFTVEVAAAPAARPTPKAPESAGPGRNPDGQGPLAGRRILVAEDGPDNQRLIAYHLRRAGAAEVVLADHGGVALEHILVDGAIPDPPGFDLIVSDLHMPEVDGRELTGRLRGLGYTGPIIALTADVMPDTAQMCLDLGCDAYIPKPLEVSELIGTCQRLCARNPRANAA